FFGTKMPLVKLSEVPEYLQDSKLYQKMIEEYVPEDVVDFKYYSKSDKMVNMDKFHEIIKVLDYWESEYFLGINEFISDNFYEVCRFFLNMKLDFSHLAIIETIFLEMIDIIDSVYKIYLLLILFRTYNFKIDKKLYSLIL